MNKHDEYADWLVERINKPLELAYALGWAEGKRALYSEDSEEFEYVRKMILKQLANA